MNIHDRGVSAHEIKQRTICSLDFLDIQAQAYGSHKDRAKKNAGYAWVMAYLDHHGDDSLKTLCSKFKLPSTTSGTETSDKVENWGYDEDGNLLLVTDGKENKKTRYGKKQRKAVRMRKLVEGAEKGSVTAQLALEKEFGGRVTEQTSSGKPLWELVPDWDDEDLVGM